MRSRKWFITINDGAECWYEFTNLIPNLVRCKYAYIIHDKEDNLHCHILLNFENARSFDSMLKMFPGAHIEECKYFNVCIRYLIHMDDKDKYQYNFADIVSNYDDSLLMELMSVDEFEYLDTENLLMAIYEGRVTCLTEAVKIWGINQVSLKRALIESLLTENQRLKSKDSYVCSLENECNDLKKEVLALELKLRTYISIYGDIEKGA